MQILDAFSHRSKIVGKDEPLLITSEPLDAVGVTNRYDESNFR